MVKIYPAKKSQIRTLISVIVCLALFFPLVVYGCSDDKEKPEVTDKNAPYSVTLSASNWNMPYGGTITSQYSDSPSGSDIGKAVDNNIKTKFITYHDQFYILWAGTADIVLSSYSLTSADDAPESDPTSWTLYGSRDQNQWTVLDKKADQLFSNRQEKKECPVENEISYPYYKLEIEGNNGGETTQIAEFAIQGVATSFDDLMQYAEGASHSSLTPMGNHYANRHVTTEEDRIWLNTPENEPAVPGSASHLHLAEFEVELYPFGEPLPADINQHAIGDCSALAIFASMAYIYPDFVKSLIKDNGDNTYTVSMFDPQGLPITVTLSSKFLAESDGVTLGAVSGKYNKATWATVLEKAIMKWNSIYQVNTDIGGIGSEHVAPLFTGNGDSFAFYPGKLTNWQLARVAQVCLLQGKIIVGGFASADLPVDGTRTVTGHAWTIMHSTEQSALFTMRNPWGGNHDAPAERDGIVNIPDNNTIPSVIDFRIIEPGIAVTYNPSGISDPYIPPYFSPTDNTLRVRDLLLPDLNGTNP